MRSRTRDGKPRTSRLSRLSLAVALLVGALVLLTKLSAAPAAALPRLFGAPTGSVLVPPPASAPPRAGASASAAPPPAPSGSDSAPPRSSVNPSQLDYTTLQGPDDFDHSMSEEQRKAVGTGRVPIHREGPYASPFAHPRFGGPAHVKVGLVLSHVREYSIQTGVFEADFFLSLTTQDKPMPDVQLAFTNGKDVQLQPLADTPTFKFYRVHGSFSGQPDLRLYPFDTQVLPIEMEELQAGVDQIVFEADPNRTSLDEGFGVSGWAIDYVGAKAYRHRYPPRFDRDDLQMSRYRFELGLDRFGLSAALSVFVPAIVIVLIALTGMWVPPSELEVRSNTGAPMLAAAVLFHYALLATLPATGYLTRADKVMMGTYVCLMTNMFTTWTFMVVDESRTDWLFRFWRIVAPLLSVIFMGLAFTI